MRFASDNEEINEKITYFLMAKYFKFSKEQVDKLDNDEVYEMLWMSEEYAKIQNELSKTRH